MRAANPWTWSRERIAMLEKLWAEGATAQTIADRLGGVSRAAVLGKIFRLRLDGGTPAAPAAAKPAQQTTQPADAKRAGVTAPVWRRRGGKCDALLERQTPAGKTLAGKTPARTRGKSLLELTNESCRWPHGRPGSARFHFCGAPGADLENGMPYCAQHARRAYVKHPSFSEDPKASATGAPHSTDSPADRRRYVWRGLVRHPAARWK
jgi:GcrA cell cycle regulator